MSFGNRLKLLREEKLLSREELSDKFNLSYSTISKYETDIRFPDQATLKMIADYFDVSTDYLLGRTTIKDGVIIDKNNIPEELRNIDVDHLVVAKYAQDKSIDAETLKEIIDAISKKESN